MIDLCTPPFKHLITQNTECLKDITPSEILTCPYIHKFSGSASTVCAGRLTVLGYQ